MDLFCFFWFSSRHKFHVSLGLKKSQTPFGGHQKTQQTRQLHMETRGSRKMSGLRYMST